MKQLKSSEIRKRSLLVLAAILLFAATTASSQTYSDLYNLGSNSGDPTSPFYIGAFTQGQDGNLYSTSQNGGTFNHGAIFRLTPAGKVTVLHNFSGADGTVPHGGLTLGTDGSLYGTTSSGGTNNLGIVFKINTSGNFTVLHNFMDAGDGLNPLAVPTQGTDGNFYGTVGQTFGPWSMYKITPSGKLTTVFTATSSIENGHTPGTLVLGTDGNFYGATQFGGTEDRGTVFKITPQGKYTMLHSFIAADGQNALSPLIQASDGNFYGIADQGGTKGIGTIYKLTPAKAFSVIYNFQSTVTGYEPHVGPVQATDGKLYSTASSITGGLFFQVSTTGAYKIVHNCDIPTGFVPQVPMFQHTNGTLYGDTSAGGTGNVSPCVSGSCGVLYSLSMGLHPFISFVGPDFLGKVGNTIEILGQGFTGTTKVSFNGAAATFKVVSNTYLTATVPSAATKGFVTVTTPGGMLTSNRKFLVLPTITSFAPISGSVGTKVVITGTGFTGTTKVTFGAKATSFIVNSNTQVTANVPTGAVTGKISITTAGGTATSATVFTVTP